MNLIRTLIGIRHAHPALDNLGKISFLTDGRPGTALSYLRYDEKEKILVALNPTRNTVTMELAEKDCNELFILGDRPEYGNGFLQLPARSAAIASL